MFDREQMAREQDADLRELAELGMSFARKLEARVEGVASVAEVQALALAFNRIARGVRLTHALRTKLARDHLEIGKLDRAAAQKAVERRKAQVTAVLDREIFTDEADQDTADHLAERLTERLDAEALFDDFLNGPLDHVIARIRKDLGLAAPDPPPGRSPIEGGEDRGLAEGKAVAIDNDLSIAVTNAHSDRRGLQPPQSAALTAPPEGEHLEDTALKPAPS
jgi:hypothetical protein